ncbi:MAG TPA: hypothetical protein VM915_15620, partial [Verrucomicrobiae bacterium]|nr:hypothetical protein [Verrucomicrobiae bacterium]
MAAIEGASAVDRIPLIAICVCTRGRPLMLQRCLTSLQAQIFDATRMQVQLIVIDNNETQSGHTANGGAHSYVHCPAPGIPLARNAA